MILGLLVNKMPSLDKPKLGGDDNTDVVRGLVREFLDMLGDGEAEPHKKCIINSKSFCHSSMESTAGANAKASISPVFGPHILFGVCTISLF